MIPKILFYIKTGMALCLLATFQAHAADDNLFFQAYNWNDSASYEAVDAHGQNVVFLKDLKAIEYVYDDEYGSLVQYSTIHKKIQVNSHEAIEEFNKHYFATARVLGIEDIRVRVISPAGSQEIEKVDLKDYEGEDRYSSYKYFAIEGVEIGSQIEYIYTLKMAPQLEGSREFFQSDELKLNNEFHIFCDAKMHFNTKSYNGFAEIQLDTAIEGKNHYFGNVARIEPLMSEPYAPYQNSLMRVEFKLAYIEPAKDVQLYTYDQISNQLNSYLREGVSKKNVSALQKLSKELKLEALGEEDKIRKVENYIKKSISVSETAGEEAEDIELILQKKVANQRGILKIYVALFEANKINFLCGLTSDRTSVSMDPEFESYNWLENYLFYFPGLKKYMAPTEMLFRLGYIPYNWSNNYGLFIKNVRIGDTNTGIGEVRFIEPLPYNASEDIIDIKLSIAGDFDSLKLNIDRKMSGYNVSFVQPVFEFLPEKERKMLIDDLMNISDKDAVLDNFSLENGSLDSFYQKPLILKGVVSTSNSFFDIAGNRYILKVGELIGNQVELYQKEERKLPVENEYNRNYQRTIEIEIPDGYSIGNLDDLTMDIVYKGADGALSMGFQSHYTHVGRKVLVKIDEFYKDLLFPRDQFEDFRKVINAAADFNKKVLVFQKN